MTGKVIIIDWRPGPGQLPECGHFCTFPALGLRSHTVPSGQSTHSTPSPAHTPTSFADAGSFIKNPEHELLAPALLPDLFLSQSHRTLLNTGFYHCPMTPPGQSPSVTFVV